MRNKHPTEQELRRQFLKESRAILTQTIDELSSGYLWGRAALRILRAWKAQKIVLGVDSTLPDHYKIDPPVFVDGWIEDGKQVHRGASNFSLFATFYDDEEARRAFNIVMRVLRTNITYAIGHGDTGRRGGLDITKAFVRGTFWSWELARDLDTREKDLQKKL